MSASNSLEKTTAKSLGSFLVPPSFGNSLTGTKLTGHLVLQGKVPFGTARFKQLLEQPTSTRWAKYPFSRCRSYLLTNLLICCLHIYIYIYIYMYTHMYICVIHVYMFICLYVYVFM